MLVKEEEGIMRNYISICFFKKKFWKSLIYLIWMIFSRTNKINQALPKLFLKKQIEI